MKLAFSLVAAILFTAQALSAQQAYFKVKVENVSPAYENTASGVFAVPVGGADPAPIGPGGSYSFDIDASPGQYLSFATMFVPSNDLFFGPAETGIALYSGDGVPTDGDVTAQIMLWDAGTEENQEPGVGPDQVQRQAAPNTGAADADNTVRLVSDGFTYPAASDVLTVTVMHAGGTAFTVTVTNVSTGETLKPSDGSMQAAPLSPGVFVVHSIPAPLFTRGEADRGLGLEHLAEDGNTGPLSEALDAVSGVTQILAPVAWAIHTEADPFFTDGAEARDNGLEMLAEDGGPGGLAGSLVSHESTTSGVQPFAVGADAPGPIGPGGAYEFTVSARPGSNLSIANMVVQSNDLFLAPPGVGIPLWDGDGTPIEGDITDNLMIWDAGTEVNEAPGFGPNQAPRQSGPNTGEDESGVVHLVDDGFTYPDVSSFAKVTIETLQTMPFTIRVENVSTGETLKPSDGSMQAVPIAPVAWVVHTNAAPLFSGGEPDRGFGLESLAEDGSPVSLAGALGKKVGYVSGAAAVPEGASEPGPIGPGGAYVFTVDAPPGAYLSFSNMFVPSNDLFFAPSEMGIALYEDGTSKTGDVTDQVMIWDAGTEMNQEPGVGPDQAQRQAGPNTGPDDPDDMVRLVNDGFSYPAVSDVIKVTIDPLATASETVGSVPEGFTLGQNYPNPFNPSTNIAFKLSEADYVKLSVYDVLGKRIASLVDGVVSGGSHTVVWNGLRVDGREAATGTYLYRIELGSGAVAETRKMLLLR
jgi:hypothetical protein